MTGPAKINLGLLPVLDAFHIYILAITAAEKVSTKDKASIWHKGKDNSCRCRYNQVHSSSLMPAAIAHSSCMQTSPKHSLGPAVFRRCHSHPKRQQRCPGCGDPSPSSCSQGRCRGECPGSSLRAATLTCGGLLGSPRAQEIITSHPLLIISIFRNYPG